MPKGDDPASLQDSKQVARWLWVSFCSCNLVLIGCKSDSQQWTWQQWQRREGGCQGFLRMHEKKARESLGPMGSAVSDLPGCLKPTQVNIRKGELPVLTSCQGLCLLTLLAAVGAWGRSAVQPSCRSWQVPSAAAGALGCSCAAAGEQHLQLHEREKSRLTLAFPSWLLFQKQCS